MNSTYINSSEYRNKFNKITNNVDINRILYVKAKEMLRHRSGTKIEDMYWIDGISGEVVASVLNEQKESTIQYTKSILKAINNKSDLITMHTHPQSMPPSVGDFNSAYYHRYAVSLILCHDGKIFRYVAREEINERLYLCYIQRYIKEGYSEYNAQLNTLLKIKENYNIDFEEVLP